MKTQFVLFIIILSIIFKNDVSAADLNYNKTNFSNHFGQVNVSITPSKQKGVFTKRTQVSYDFSVKNGIAVDQVGYVSYTVTDAEGTTVLEKSFDVNVPANRKMATTIVVPHTIEGTFTIVFNVELNNIKSVFNFKFSFSILKDPAIKPVVEKKQRIKQVETDNSEVEGEIKTILKPKNSDGIFINKEPIEYNLELRNTYPIAQEGTFRYKVKEAINGTVVSEKIFDVKLPKKGSKTFKLKIPSPGQAGIYNLDFSINTTTYDDTTHYAFGYNIDRISSPFHRPDDFDQFWKTAMEELAEVNPAYKIQEDKDLSNQKFKVYQIEMSSLGDIRIGGILTIPRTTIGGKFPVLVGFGGYQVMARPLMFDEFVSFTVNVRGADKENSEDINPEKQELLTLNITDPLKYVYRGVYMDCIRAIDFLIANEDMGIDVNRIAVFGGSQGGSFALITSALLNKTISTCVADNPTFCDYHVNFLMEPQIRENSFILEYMNKYLKANENTVTRNDLLQSLSYFEVQNFMPKIKCPVLFGIGLLDPLAPAVTTIAAYNKMNLNIIKQSEIYIFPELAHEVPERHNTFKSTWFFEKLAKSKN